MNMQKLFGTVLVSAGVSFAALADSGDAHIVLDQFGYRTGDAKVAVIRQAQIGYDAPDSYVPGDSMQVRRFSDNSIAFRGAVVAWNGGAVQDSAHSNGFGWSGDKGWWFDFSSVVTPGDYYLYDPTTAKKSHRFLVADSVYRGVLKAATRMYFYQREGFAKTAPYAGNNWTDGASHGNDSVAQPITGADASGTIRDMRGGWMDAGDQNKYVTFLDGTIHPLLDAYQNNPAAFGDDNGIPESGNGVADLLDEIDWELQWLKRMQDTTDGGVFIKEGSKDWSDPSPPSTDTRTRWYGPKCSSAGWTAAGVFAHAAYVYAHLTTMAPKVADLRKRAEAAWDWALLQPVQTNCDDGTIKSGDADRDAASQDGQKVLAAVWLFALTGDSEYGNYVKNNYTDAKPYSWWGPYDESQGSALLFYTTLPGADAGASADILSIKSGAMSLSDYYKGDLARDLYRSAMPKSAYHWGSCQPRANGGNINLQMIQYGIDQASRSAYETRALGFLQHFHGVNPMGKVMLSNMYSYGAENSVNEMYHTWFADGTAWDNVLTSAKGGPAPGYVVGGPNYSFVSDCGNATKCATIAPPAGQPPQKSYKDWNTGWNASLSINETSYGVTEPAIYYQASYIKLLSHFVDSVPGAPAYDPDQVVSSVKPGSVVTASVPRVSLQEGLLSLEGTGNARVRILAADGTVLRSMQSSGVVTVNLKGLHGMVWLDVRGESRLSRAVACP